MLGSCVLLYSRLSLRFSLMRSRMAWLIGDLRSLRLYTLGADVSTAFMINRSDSGLTQIYTNGIRKH